MILAVWKPIGPSSNQFLNQIKKLIKIKKVGHAGTLDPLASGILVIAIGRESTKKLSKEVAKEKEYEAVIKLGEESSTDDEEGKKTFWKINSPPLFSEVQKVVSSFTGLINQTPPQYSAVKIAGKEAYKYARIGQKVKIKSRKVLIKNIEIINYNYPYLEIRVITGPGVYIRTLSKDIGKKLATGGHIADLERTRVGEFTKENTVEITKIPSILDTMKVLD